MTHIEAAEYFEEMNPNLYAGAGSIARLMTGQMCDIAEEAELKPPAIHPETSLDLSRLAE